jgi:hypothetical protein
MTDDKNASLAATALADSQAGAPVTNPNAPVGGAALAQSGVGFTVAAAPEAAGGPIGRTIHGRYRIKRLLGEGGMGGVYEGEHLEIGKRVAIKLVHALHARDPHIAARIKQEARSTGAIESENIVQVFDAGEDEQLGIFLVMELLKGEDLLALLARKTRVSPMAAATMVVQAAQGLSRAHAAGIVHRDLKPANIFVCTRDDGSTLVKLVDFGIAKLIRDANQAQNGQNPGLTRMGMVIGTPQYMSPEQAQGLLTVDHRTDIYSLGAVLFEAIVGSSPYPEMPTYEQTILQIMTRPAPRISQFVPSIPAELDQLCADMMAHDPGARPADMMNVRERLVRVFPEIDGGRLPMRSLTNEAYESPVSADASGQLRAQRDAALARAGLSGVGAAAPRLVAVTPATPPAVVDGSQVTESMSEALAGIPPRRNGALIGVVAVLALAVGVGGVALVKMRSGGAEAPPGTAGFGLVQSTVSTPTATPAKIAPPPEPAATAPEALPAPVAAAPAATAGSRTHHSAAAVKVSAKSPASPPPAAPAAPAPPEREKESSRPVGGTGLSTEF